MNYTYSYLALGDSYTIGEAVLPAENFSYQTVQMLRQQGYAFSAPEIIAKTGWTTDELSAAITQHTFLEKYDVVSLLIGVNNQYRGRSVEEFEKEFTGLLQQAIGFAGNDAAHVFVLSIPDWGVTPFAKDRDQQKIAEEIDQYNAVCKAVSANYHVTFIDITTAQRADSNEEGMVAGDGLHPGKKEYFKWAEKLNRAVMDNVIMDNE
ncbi:SGNH/GDSL hydrolase family protein [Ferruginibacter sp. HRS2-29]|uniref:SGNH/GDSL hydrolase family protein n=1 Tax=Ferruginibacter sp. HRS2-29 TaxID=2487334 RepID=UPI0020CCD0CB|nr:SGNH/GDSL hydrolase family protein [Ferruginibacter sp. HRS2-29]MCP9753262.1 SGNH/GDSL hydrolase family protein [Ferruginibacter sp. HRS2-29]